jgi:hypothetical protein
MKGKRKTTQPVPEEQLKEMLDLENKPEIEPSEYEKIVEFWKQQGLKEEDIPLNIKNKRKVVAPPGEEIVPVEPAFVESTSDSAVFQKPIEKHQTEPIEITEDFTKVLKTFEKYQVDPLEISDERMVWLKTFERFAFEPAELESVHEYAVMNMPLEPCIIYHYEGNGTFETIMIYPVMKRIPPREVDCPIWDKTTWVKPKPLEKKAIVLDPVTPVPVPDKPKEPEFVPEKIPEAKLKPKPKEVNLAVRARPKKRAADSDDEKAPDESTPVAESPPKKKEGLTPEERERLDELLAKLLDGLKPEELDELKNLLKQDGMTEEEIALKLKPKAKPIVNDIAVAPPKAKPKEVNLNVKPKPRKRAADSDEEEPKEQDLGLNPKERKRLDELLDRPVLTPEQWDECVALLKKDGVKDEDLPLKMKGKKKTTDPLTEEEKKLLDELMDKPVLTPEEWKECEGLLLRDGVKEEDLPLKMKDKRKTTDPEPEKPKEDEVSGLNPKERKRLDELLDRPVLTPEQWDECVALLKKDGVKDEDLPLKMKGKKKTTDPLTEEEKKLLDELMDKPVLTPEEWKECEGLLLRDGVKEEDLPLKMKDKRKTTDPEPEKLKEDEVSGLNPKERKRLDELLDKPVLTPEQWDECVALLKKDGVKDEDLPLKMKGKKKTTDPLTEEEKKLLDELMDKPVLTPEEWKECEGLLLRDGVKEEDLPLKMKGKRKTTDPEPEKAPEDKDIGLNPKQRKRLEVLLEKPVLTPEEWDECVALLKKDGVKDEDLPLKMKDRRKTTDPEPEKPKDDEVSGLNPKERKKLDELLDKPVLTPEEWDECVALLKKDGVKDEDLPLKMKDRRKTTDPDPDQAPEEKDLGLNPKERKKLDELLDKPVLTPEEWDECVALLKKDGVKDEDLPLKMKDKRKTTDPEPEKAPEDKDLGLNPKEKKKLDQLMDKPVLTPEEWDECVAYLKKDGVKDEDLPLKMKDKRKTTDPEPEQAPEDKDLGLNPKEKRKLDELMDKPVLTPEEWDECVALLKKDGVKDEDLPLKMKDKRKTTDPEPEQAPEDKDLGLNPKEKKKLDELLDKPVLTPEEWDECVAYLKKDGVKDEDLPLKMKNKRRTTDPEPEQAPEDKDLGLNPKERKKLDELMDKPVLTPEEWDECVAYLKKDGVKDEDLPLKMKDKRKTTDPEPEQAPEDKDLGLNPKEKKKLDELLDKPVLTPEEWDECVAYLKKDGVKDEDLPLKMKNKRRTTDPEPEQAPEDKDLGLNPKEKRKPIEEPEPVVPIDPDHHELIHEEHIPPVEKDADINKKNKNKPDGPQDAPEPTIDEDLGINPKGKTRPKGQDDPEKPPEEDDLAINPKGKRPKNEDPLDPHPIEPDQSDTVHEEFVPPADIDKATIPKSRRKPGNPDGPEEPPNDEDLAINPKQPKKIAQVPEDPKPIDPEHSELVHEEFSPPAEIDEKINPKGKPRPKGPDEPEEGPPADEDLSINPKPRPQDTPEEPEVPDEVMEDPQPEPEPEPEKPKEEELVVKPKKRRQAKEEPTEDNPAEETLKIKPKPRRKPQEDEVPPPLLSAAPESDLKDLNFLTDNLESLTDVIDSRPLEPSEIEDLRTVIDKIAETKPEDGAFDATNLDVPSKLADLATNPNIPPELAEKALETMIEMVKDPEVLARVATEGDMADKIIDAFVDSAKPPSDTMAEAICEIAKNPAILEKMKNDPEFMEKLQEEFKKDPLNPQIAEMFLSIMEELTKDEDKTDVFHDPDGPSALEDLYEKKCDILPILRRTARVTGNMAKDAPTRDKLAGEGSIGFMDWGLNLYPTDLPLNVNTAWAVRRLCRHHPENSKKILDSNILKWVSKCLGQNIDSNELAEHACHAVVNITYMINPFKLEIERWEFLEKVCKCFAYYSKEDNLCQKNVLASLKALANMTVMPVHCASVANAHTIEDFVDYFKRHQEPLRSQIMLGVVGNIGYEYNPKVLKDICDQGAVGLVGDAVHHFNEKNDVETLLCAIDTLGTIAHNKQICAIISDYEIVEPVTRMLKGQDWNEDLVYKTTRCLYRICVDEKLREDAIINKAHEVTSEIIDKYFTVDKVLFNAFRLMNTLITIADKETVKDVFDTNLIDKIVNKFYDELSTPICSELFLMFIKMCCLDPANEEIGTKFSRKLVSLMKKRMDDKAFMAPAMDLLNELALYKPNIDALYVADTLPLTKEVMKKYVDHPELNQANLQVIAEFAKDSEPMRQECLNEKLDEETDLLIEKIDETMEPLYMTEAKTVQMLLRGEEKLTRKKGKNKMALDEDEDMELPIEVIQFVTAGKTMELYGEDGEKRTFHFFMTKDYKDLQCKRPNERKAKQKWLMPMSGIKDIVKGYDKGTDSPFEKCTGFFSRNPDTNTCFSIFGPTTDYGDQNFHFKCDNQKDRDKWVDYINMVKKYVRIKSKRALKKRKDYEDDAY